ncbi:MAG: tetratricopeptide repeat protein [Flavobacteriales bacterium]|nr:tetratricopeptide repeat protein [Flavobacteriales bacterium]
MKSHWLFFLVFLTIISFTACHNNGGNPSDAGGNGGNGTNNQTETPDSVLEELNRLIAQDPNNYLNYLNRAKYFGDHDKFTAAMDDIRRAIAIDSTKADIYLYKGILLFDHEKVSEAYEEYKNCLRFDAQNTDCMLKKAGIDIVLGNYDVSRELINEALKINEYNAYAYYLRGRLYKTIGDTGLAASSYKTAIEVDPDYYDAYIEVGLLYAAQKNDLANEYYSSAIQIKPRSIEAWYNRAMFLQENGIKKKNRYKDALTCYDSILRIDPKFVAAEFNKGYVWLEYLANYDSSAFYFSRAIASYPQYYQAYYNRGLSFESLGKKKEAEQDYRAALSIKPDYSEAAIALNRVTR